MHTFEEAVELLGFSIDELELKHIHGGANNNVFGLAHKGTPWAISVSFPKSRDISPAKLASYERLVKICDHLTTVFGKGVEIDSSHKFVFDGRCFLVEPASLRNFIEPRDNLPENYASYTGTFLVKKGAPASETLEHSLEFKDIMIQGLCILHKRTGLIKLVDKKVAVQITKRVLELLDRSVIPEEAEKFVEKFSRKWGESRKKDIIREVKLRSDKNFDKIVKNAVTRHKECLCLVHGDAHGGNFIVVQYENKQEVHPIDVEDVQGIEDSEKEHYLLDLVKFTISAYNLSRIFKQPLSVEELIGTYYENFSRV